MSDFHFLCKKFWLNFWLFWKLYLAINGQIWQRRRLDEKSWSGSTGSRGQGDQVPAPILPKSRRESGLPVLESRQSFSRAQVLYHKSHYPHYCLWMFYSSRPVNFGYAILVLCHVKTMMVCGEGFFLIFCYYFLFIYSHGYWIVCTLHDSPPCFCLFFTFSMRAQPSDSTAEHVSNARKLSQSLHEPTVFKVSWNCNWFISAKEMASRGRKDERKEQISRL